MSGYIRIIRVYGMEGAAAEEGEAQTRNIESSYRRLVSAVGRARMGAGRTNHEPQAAWHCQKWGHNQPY